ncbi:hypothetical protein WN51_10604 [Melipona quadrifasciata]|uniref:Uncharacterized protein n=1 Tax=Melipona quadrifasciata TaxID=166423 RepID=A0A0N0BIR4_9HYME|nr:hypothetical protein WN51_10604 [Melipona quadrifasciata]
MSEQLRTLIRQKNALSFVSSQQLAPRIDETTTTTTASHFQLCHATFSSFELLSESTTERRAQQFEPYEINATTRVTRVPAGDSRSLSLDLLSVCPLREGNPVQNPSGTSSRKH